MEFTLKQVLLDKDLIKEELLMATFSSFFLHITNYRSKIHYDINNTPFSLPNHQTLSVQVSQMMGSQSPRSLLMPPASWY